MLAHQALAGIWYSMSLTFRLFFEIDVDDALKLLDPLVGGVHSLTLDLCHYKFHNDKVALVQVTDCSQHLLAEESHAALEGAQLLIKEVVDL